MNFSDFRMLLLQQFSRNSYKIKEMLRQIKKDRVKIEFSRSRNHLKKSAGPPAHQPSSGGGNSSVEIT